MVPQKSAATADNTGGPFWAALTPSRMPASSEYTRNTSPPNSNARPLISTTLHCHLPIRRLTFLAMLKNVHLPQINRRFHVYQFWERDIV